MKVSIVVITHDKLSYLRGTLAALDHVRFPQDAFEVVVVDDGSSDGTSDYVRGLETSYPLQLVQRGHGTGENGENGKSGVAAARNAGCAVARGELLIMLDDDCLLHPDSAARLWAAHQRHPDAILLSRIPHVDIAHVPELIERLLAGDADYHDGLEGMKPDDRLYALEELIRQMLGTGIDRFSVPWLAAQGCSVSFGAETYSAIGRYDDGFVLYGMEDFEFAYRHFDQDGRFVAVEGSRLFHMDHGHPGATLFREMTRSARRFYTKYDRAPELALFVRFLCGQLNFRDFNNGVAEERGRPAIADLGDLLFSPYGMIRYRDNQLAAGGEGA